VNEQLEVAIVGSDIPWMVMKVVSIVAGGLASWAGELGWRVERSYVLPKNATLSQPLQSGYVESNNSFGDCCGGGGGGEKVEQLGRTKIWECQAGPGWLWAC
jgi:hypothetical protein